MPFPRILVIYATSYGQTAKIAHHVEELLTAAGCEVTLVNAETTPPDLLSQDFAAVVVGGSVLFGRHQRVLDRFVRANRDYLNAVRSAFFSVSGSAAATNAVSQEKARRQMTDFLRATGWSPAIGRTVAGAVAYTKYNPLLRFVMKRISAKEGLSTDTSRDHEATDWKAVAQFVDDVVVTMPQQRRRLELVAPPLSASTLRAI